MRPAESNTFITFRIIIFSVDLDGRYSQRAEDIYAPIAEARRAPRRRERSARSFPRSASFFCSEAAFNLQLTRRLIRREPREPEEGATRARDIIIKSVCKVGCARSLGRCQRRVVSFAIQAQYLHGRQVDKSYRSRSPPRSSGE